MTTTEFYTPGERSDIAQDIHAMRYANENGVEAIARAMQGLHRWTAEAQLAYQESMRRFLPSSAEKSEK